MALVKKAALGKSAGSQSSEAKAPDFDPSSGKPVASQSDTASTTARRGMSHLERLDIATQELAGGLGQSAAAAAQLQRSIEQISGSAEEAAGAAQESLGLIGHLRSNFQIANARAGASLSQTERLQVSFSETANQIDASVGAIALNANRQLGSVETIKALEAAATRVGAVGRTVGELAERTNLLALNAAIEAARAGESGRGFAIVADEVRELAEGAENNATDVEALAASIAEEVAVIAARIHSASGIAAQEAGNGAAIVTALAGARDDLAVVLSGASEIASAAIEAEAAAQEAEQGAEQVASAAEEQSSATAEAQQAIEQQAVSLEESQQTAKSLGELSAELQANNDALALEQIAAAAEELSATVQELSSASSQIQIAIEQIAQGAQTQSAATQQTSAAMAQIESSADLAAARASEALDRIDSIVAIVDGGSRGLGKLIGSVGNAVAETRAVLDLLAMLGDTARRVEKITDALGLAALQTNMLGVSGAIEATRAGEAGQGFATVTADIRKLARSLAMNAADGKDVVRDIQDQVAIIRRDLEQIAGAAEAEAGRNQALIDRFAAMASDLDAVRADNLQILEGSQAIKRAAGEVRAGCDEIAKAAELASDATSEAGAAAGQQAQGAENLAAAIEDIASLAASLRNVNETTG